MTDATDAAMRQGFRELQTQDAFPCSCYAISDHDGVIHPVLCSIHRDDLNKARANFLRLPKYSRYFDREQDAKDRVRIIYDRWPAEGYDTYCNIFTVGRWFLVMAKWADSCE